MLKPNLMKFFCLTIQSVFLVCAGVSYAVAANAPKTLPLEFQVLGLKPGLPYKGVEHTLKTGEAFRYYTSDNSNAPRPLVIFFPGSGCDGAFSRDKDGAATASLEGFITKYLPDTRVLILERRGIPRQYESSNPGAAIDCPAEYAKHDNFDDAATYYYEVLKLARQRHWMDSGKVMLVGMSEGVLYAAEMARRMPVISKLTLISGFRDQQLFSLVHNSLNSKEPIEPNKTTTLKETRELIEQWQAIKKEPHSTTKLFLGHPYSRWSTTAVQSPIKNVLASKADLFVIQGGKDTQSPSAGFELAISELILFNRHFTMEYIGCGDHHLICEKDKGAPINLNLVMQHSFEWFLGKPIVGENVIVVNAVGKKMEGAR